MQTQTFYPKLRLYYRSLVPLFEKPNVAAYTMLVLSFFTMAIFGTFAIRPTLATIVQLKKSIADAKVVNTKMDDKIAQLRLAEVAYQNVSPDLDAIFESLPQNPEAASLLGKLNRTLIENNIDVTVLQISAISLTEPKTSSPSATVIGFSLTGRAAYEDILTFIDLLSRADRILTIDTVDISAGGGEQTFGGESLTIAIRGKSYVLWENLPARPAGGGNGREGKGKTDG